MQYTYGWVVVCKGVVDAHIFEEPSDVHVEEALHFLVIELGVDKEGADVRFDNVRQTLRRIGQHDSIRGFACSTHLRGVLDYGPVVSSTVRVSFRFRKLRHILPDLVFD